MFFFFVCVFLPDRAVAYHPFLVPCRRKVNKLMEATGEAARFAASFE